MHEPEFYNNTPFKAAPAPYLDRHGRDVRVVLIKASYAIKPGDALELLEEQRDFRLGNEPWGDPEVADYKFPGELCAFKPGTDFVIAGHAISQTGKPVPHIDVAVTFAGRSSMLRAHGPRRWEGRGGSLSIGAAQAIDRVPMCWALAYGGLDASDPRKVVECKENPVGRGVARDPRVLSGMPAPQIEDPRQPIKEPNQEKVQPVGLGPLGPMFEPRRTLAGTYDKRWLEEVHPAKPPDYQEAFEQVAARAFVFEEPLRGRELGSIRGMTQGGELRFQLPLERPYVEWTIDGKLERKEPHLDSVLVDTDEKVLELMWRVSVRTPPKLRNHFTLLQVFKKKVLDS